MMYIAVRTDKLSTPDGLSYGFGLLSNLLSCAALIPVMNLCSIVA